MCILQYKTLCQRKKARDNAMGRKKQEQKEEETEFSCIHGFFLSQGK